ncbi:hemerythrin domain-containing protein [Microlunatus sp. Gsoil 973]|jgi:hemerythrin superfamily protein|uniref:hemerythrin domain-containing protein n=1 Tax=Microlunatus sp. Gsoil 973 TaxID=2672569 RepID=UPI0012B47B80|nr:hemerythrin domain-containing protein [Microlunatus sp. Gsoil 973]QGN32856.1 hemerythrin domain-containing protein [Microlunatus sp. Gsoil 973]
MGSATEDRQKAAQLPEGDVIRLLLNQHAQIRDLFDEVESSHGEQRHDAFEELRGLLAVHETAEEMVLRPVTEDIAADGVAAARNSEEQEANEVLKQLETFDVDSADFEKQFAELKTSVDEHAENEEHEEFPAVLEHCDADQRARMGRRIEAVEKVAPTRPHPTAAGKPAMQWTVGPFAALIDKARDAVASIRD